MSKSVPALVNSLTASFVAIALLGCGGGGDTLPGTWSRTSVLVSQPEGSLVTQSAAPTEVPGSAVPGPEEATAALCANYAADFNTAADARILSCSGNIGSYANVSGNDRFVFAPVAYSGCGSCDTGSRVIVRYSLQVTTSTASRFDFLVTTSYTRLR